MKENTPPFCCLLYVHMKLCPFRCLISGLKIKFDHFSGKITSFSKTLLLHTSEGAVSHNVLYYQQLSVACSQVSFYANNYL